MAPTSRAIVVLVLGAALSLLTGCPGTLDPSQFPGPGSSGTGGAGNVVPPPCDAPNTYFKSTDPTTGCGTQGACHDVSGASSISKVNLVDDNVWSRLLNMPATSASGPACVGMPLVDGTNRANSVIIKRVSGSACGAGTLMPFGSTTVNKQIADCIAGWVYAQ